MGAWTCKIEIWLDNTEDGMPFRNPYTPCEDQNTLFHPRSYLDNFISKYVYFLRYISFTFIKRNAYVKNVARINHNERS